MKWWENFGRHARKKIDYKLRNPSSSGCKISEISIPYQIWDSQP